MREIGSSEELSLAAARIKATTGLPVADAWIAATAEQRRAELVHKDPEFEALRGRIGLGPLPYKTRSVRP